jgi:hypothetical protein
MDENHKPERRGRYDGDVAVWFTSHYPLHDRDWKNIREFEGAYHPLAGYYDPRDPSVLRQQLRWMRRAGIDLIVYDCFSTSKETPLTELPNDETLRLLLSELADQSGESRKIKLCMWLERYADNPSLEDYRFALSYIREHMAERDFYYLYDGRPLIVTYLNGAPGANRAIDQVEVENTYFELRRIRPFETDVWSYIENYPQMLRRGWMSACPGFNSFLENAYMAKYMHTDRPFDLDAVRKASSKADREDGAFYERQLLLAKQTNPHIIFVSGWNDWQYGNHIEPAVEYRFQYVDLTAKVLGRWQETEPYRDGGA